MGQAQTSLAALAFVLAFQPAAFAQDAQTTADDVAEIVVTAQGRQQRLQDVPISASVMSGEALASGNLKNLEELTARLPAVKLTAGPASDLLNIRGVGSGLNGGFEQSVATFVDGVYRGRSRSSRAALFDIDRVEVLKGPQTTFFGNNAIAGALNITTRKAKIGGDTEFNGSALYAPTDGEFAIEGGISTPVTDDMSLRVAAKYFGMNGYVENTHLDAKGPRQRDFVGRTSLAWDVTPGWRADLRVDYGRLRAENAFPNEVVGCPSDSPLFPDIKGVCARYLEAAGADADGKLNYKSEGGESFFKLNYTEVALTNEIDVGRHVLTAISSFYHHNTSALTQLAPFPLTGVGGVEYLFPTYSPETYRSFSQEVRLQSPTGQLIEYMVGAYFAKADLEAAQTTGYFFNSFGARAPDYTTADSPIAARYLHDQHDRTVSVFGSATANLSAMFRVNAGLRYSSVHKRAAREGLIGLNGYGPDVPFTILPEEAQLQLGKVIGVRGGDFLRPTRTDDQFMPSVSVQADLAPNIMAYASFTKGFKAGGYSISQQGDDFDPETVNAYETGIKGSLLNRRLTFSLAGFLSDYANLQESTNVVTPSGATQTVVGNVAKARSKGVELSLTGRVSPALSLNADVAYLDARYSEYPGAPCTIYQSLSASPCSQDLSGARRAYSPEFSGNIGASLSIPVGDFQLRADPNLNFSTRYFQQASADPLTEQKGYAKLDLRLGFGPEDRNWEFAIIGKNLTDVATGSFRNNIPTSPGTIYVLPDRPFSIAFQISVKR